jgi:hypothetical protein
MQVVCGNCQLSFQAPDGATGLVCPICRSPLRAQDAAAEPEGVSVRQVVEWSGGSLDDLVALLSPPAWSARIEVLPSGGGEPVGEVHVIAGGVSEAIHGGKSTHDALDKLRATKSTRFRVEPRLPNPSDGDLTFPGPDQGKLEERSLANLMRYCEDYVLTAGIEVWRASENAKVDYRRGEIVGVTVGGIDAPERLAEVMKWSSGSYRLLVPKLTLPETAPKAAVPAAVVVPRSAGAASKTIFGMPALDPAAIALASERAKAAKAQAAQQAKTTAPVPAPARPSSPSMRADVSLAQGVTMPPDTATTAPPTGAPAPAAPPPPAAAGISARQNPAKTIFGVQAPGAAPAQPPAAAPTASSPAAATPPSRPTAPAISAARESREEDKKAATAPAAAARTNRPSGPAEKPAAVPAPAAPRTHAPVAVEGDRTVPTKAPKQKNPETPVWTYVGVGFIFGLALLGVYRLVMVLAH